MQATSTNSGFTLLELLAVLAVLGVLLALAAPSYLASIQRARLAEAQNTVYAELYRARSTAQRRSVSQAITWTPDSISAGAGRSVTLPNGARIATPPAGGNIYTAPHGELSSPDGLRVELVDASGRWHTAVDGVGVTGKVLRRAVVAMSAPIR